MKTNKLCSSLELSKQLKKNGFPQSGSCFRWCIGGDKCENEWTLIHCDDESASYIKYYAAPTAAEILEELPETVKINKKLYSLFILPTDYSQIHDLVNNKIENNIRRYKVMYCEWGIGNVGIFDKTSLVSALGSMFNYLKEKYNL